MANPERPRLGDATRRGTPFWSVTALKGLVSEAGLTARRAKGAAFYPPSGPAAAALGRLDPLLGRATTLGAAFPAVEAAKAGP